MREQEQERYSIITQSYMAGKRISEVGDANNEPKQKHPRCQNCGKEGTSHDIYKSGFHKVQNTNPPQYTCDAVNGAPREGIRLINHTPEVADTRQVTNNERHPHLPLDENSVVNHGINRTVPTGMLPQPAQADFEGLPGVASISAAEIGGEEEEEEVSDDLSEVSDDLSEASDETESLSSEDELEEADAPVDTLFPWDETKNYTKAEFAVWMLNYKMDHNLSDVAFRELLKVLGELVPEGSNLPSSCFDFGAFVDAKDAWEFTEHYCEAGCKRYPKLPKDQWLDNKEEVCGVVRNVNGVRHTCNISRFIVSNRKNNSTPAIRPRKYFFYFGVENAFRDLFAQTDFPRWKAWKDTREQDDIWKGNLVKRMDRSMGGHLDEQGNYVPGELLQEEEVSVPGSEEKAYLRKSSIIDFGYDGAKLWMRKQWSTGFMMMRPLDLPFWRRGKVKYTKCIAMWPGPCEPDYFKMRDIFLEPFIDEMIKLDDIGMNIVDPYLGISYCFKPRVATFSGDTPARCTVLGTKKQGAFRADYRSIFAGNHWTCAKKGLYYCGYSEQVGQKDFRKLMAIISPSEDDDADSVPDEMKMHAYDSRLLLDHESCLKLHEAVKDDKDKDGMTLYGRYPKPPLARLPHFDMCFGPLLPWIHAGIWGIVRDFWRNVLLKKDNIDRPGWTLNEATKKKISELGNKLVLPSSVGRPYTDVITKSGTWIMEDWLRFLEISYIFDDALIDFEPDIFQAWNVLRLGCAHYVLSHGWYEGMGLEEKVKHRMNARKNLLTYAQICDKHIGKEMCTINMRLLVIHSFRQEDETGPIRHTTEFWVERYIGIMKKNVRKGLIKNPELSMGNRMLLQSAISQWFREGGRDLRDIRKLQKDKEVGDSALSDSSDYEGSFLGVGKIVINLEDNIDDNNALQEFSDIVRDRLGTSTDWSVLTFDSMKRWGTVFHSKDYTRATVRRTYHVAFKDGDDGTSFGAILKYYLVRAGDAVLRLVEIDHHRTIMSEPPSDEQIDTLAEQLRARHANHPTRGQYAQAEWRARANAILSDKLRVVPRVKSREAQRRVIDLDAVLNLVLFFPQPEDADANAHVTVLQLNSTGRF